MKHKVEVLLDRADALELRLAMNKSGRTLTLRNKLALLFRMGLPRRDGQAV